MLKNRGDGGRAEISKFERNFVRTHDQSFENLYHLDRKARRLAIKRDRNRFWVRPADHFAGRNLVKFWPCGAIMKTSNFAAVVALAFFETM